MKDDEQSLFKVVKEDINGSLVFSIASPGHETVDILAFNPKVYYDHKKICDEFITDLVTAIAKKGCGEVDLKIDTIKPSQLN